jgi:hypothetical protein
MGMHDVTRPAAMAIPKEGYFKPEKGLASRTRRQIVTGRCFTRDEGRSLGAGNQVLASSHRKLLTLRAKVVSVAEKAGTRFRQVRSREASASKPSMKCRNRIRRCQNRGLTLVPGSVRGMH